MPNPRLLNWRLPGSFRDSPGPSAGHSSVDSNGSSPEPATTPARGSARPGRTRAFLGRAARISNAFGIAAWIALVICGFLIGFIPSGGSSRKVAESATAILVATMFLLLAGRLISAAIAWRERRYAALSLVASLAMWVLGSSALTATKQPDLMSFPAPGEGFFLASYALMAVFLGLDAADRARLTTARALDAVVTCGGAVCLAGAVLLSPLDDQLAGHGTDALLALVYPLLDLLLFLIVLADLALRRRVWSRPTAALLTGFAGMAIADSTFVANLTGGVYDFSGWLLVCWAGSLAFIVAGACGPKSAGPGDEVRNEPVWAPLLAAAAAVVVLVIRPEGETLSLLGIPATITLAAAGGRLALALKAARGAAEAYRLSLTDELTGLPNRRALLARIRERIERDEPMGLLLVDLDGFKEVNDTLGHIAGDSVLRLLAQRLRTGMSSGGGLLARLGGDEFAVVLPVRDPDRALQAAEQIRGLIAEPIEAHEHLFSMNASVGVAVTSANGQTADGDELLRRADIAMYQAKNTRSGQLLYDRSRDEFTTDRLKLAEYLRYGIAAGELRVWYQPQVEAADGAVSGLEALVRWQHPDLGLLAPSDFLAVARHSGLMPALTEAVIGLVLSDVRAWASSGMDLRVSFNFAPPELLNAPLLERILDRVDGVGLPPDSLVLEVTEDSFLTEPERARQALIEIRRHHVQVSIDDYGTGFSSLSYLRDLPVHELKLDRSFVRAVGTDPRSRIIVESTTQMARGLGLRTVAEGVEDAFILSQVQALGIDVIQGYHISRPMPSAHVAEWIKQRGRVAPPIQAIT